MYKIYTANKSFWLHFKVKIQSTFFFFLYKTIDFSFERYIHSAADAAFKAEIASTSCNSVQGTGGRPGQASVRSVRARGESGPAQKLPLLGRHRPAQHHAGQREM